MDTTTANAKGYHEVILSQLKEATWNGARIYISKLQDNSFYYDADKYDEAILNFQNKYHKQQGGGELGFPDFKGLNIEGLNRRVRLIDTDRTAFTIEPGSIIATNIEGTLTINACIMPYVALDNLPDDAFIFGLRGLSTMEELYNLGSIPIMLRRVSEIVTWDLLGIDFSKVDSNGSDKDRLAAIDRALPIDFKQTPLTPISEETKVAADDLMDLIDPKWPYGPIKKGAAREWKEMVGEDVREQWQSFSANQRAALRETFRNIADLFTAYDAEGT